MCVKSSEGGCAASKAAGELLHHLEEKMEVAGIAVGVGGCAGVAWGRPGEGRSHSNPSSLQYRLLG